MALIENRKTNQKSVEKEKSLQSILSKKASILNDILSRTDLTKLENQKK